MPFGRPWRGAAKGGAVADSGGDGDGAAMHAPPPPNPELERAYRRATLAIAPLFAATVAISAIGARGA
jgi:hypothetical protein